MGPEHASEEPAESVTIRGPFHAVRRSPLLPRLRRHLCPALERVSGDAFEIARLITPLLAALKISGKEPLNLDPWLFAGLALMIERVGVAAFCAGEEEKDDADPPEAPQPAAPTRRRSREAPRRRRKMR
jgi:hypothetical protein